MKVSKKTRALRGSIKALDDAARRAVFERDGYKCVRTGRTDNIQWAHVFSRRDKRIRWNPDNALTLSAGAHMWWHHEPAESIAWFMSSYFGRVRIGSLPTDSISVMKHD